MLTSNPWNYLATSYILKAVSLSKQNYSQEDGNLISSAATGNTADIALLRGRSTADKDELLARMLEVVSTCVV